jgi:hypothetical protein
MNGPAKRRSGRHDGDRDAGLMFWFWLPVIGAAIALAFIVLSWWIGF